MKIAAQKIIGRRVRDANGKVVGRIHAAQAEIRGKECVILEWWLGPAAMLSRLGISARRLIGWAGKNEPMRVPWDQLDISDPENPVLRVSAEDLQ